MQKTTHCKFMQATINHLYNGTRCYQYYKTYLILKTTFDNKILISGFRLQLLILLSHPYGHNSNSPDIEINTCDNKQF